MKMKFPFLTIALLLVFGCGNKMLKEAEKAYSNEQFYSAAKIYETVIKEDPDPTSILHLADCYRHMNRLADAEKWYSKAINSPEATPEDKLNYAKVLKAEGNCVAAIPMYDDYLKSTSSNIAANNQKSSCLSKEEYEIADPFYLIEKKDFGFGSSCFSPAKFGTNLLVTASTPSKIGLPVDDRTGLGYLDLFVISFEEKEIVVTNTNGSDGISSPAVILPLEGSVNSPLHEGPAILSPLNNILYFTRSIRINNEVGTSKDHINRFELCTAEFINGKWSNIKSLSFNNSEYSVGHPALSSDGTRLFFVSDMPGGSGGTDIYYSDFSNGIWSRPVNAGDKINTNGNEMFPSIRMVNAGTDEFYFSSDGLPGAGGLDLFRCKMENGIPLNPERLKTPFNSSHDDFGMFYNTTGNSGYFSSNRGNADGKDEIFSFKRRDPKFFVKVDVLEKGTHQPFKLTSIEVKNINAGEIFNLTTDEKGSVVFPADSLTSYGFCIRNKEVFACYAGVSTSGFRGFFSDTSFVTLNAEKIVINKPIRLENIYYDYNKWNIRPDAAVEIDKLVKILIDNPQIKIELSSHTDSRGSDKYNMTLSQKRAQAAVDYIVSKGVSRDRITAKGYGESVTLNRCLNGVKCTEEEWQFNRRTEFKVTSIIQQ